MIKPIVIFLSFLLAACSTHNPSVDFGNYVFDVAARKKSLEFTQYITSRTVLITSDCEPKYPNYPAWIGNAADDFDGRGSGIIIRSSNKGSYIFTADHVIGNRIALEPFITCTTKIVLSEDINNVKNKNHHLATILTVDKKRDIAVLHTDYDFKVNTDLNIDPFLGEDVWAVGFPKQMINSSLKRLSITKGQLATKDVLGPDDGRKGSYYRITSQIYFGSSGGGIWNCEGKLIGIVDILLANSDGIAYEGFYYIKPVDEVVQMLKKSKKYNLVFKPDLDNK